MSIDAAAFKKGMRHLAASVTLITTRHLDRRGGLTATAVCSVSAEPPQLLACVNRRSETHRVIDQSGVFAINVLASDQQELCDRFAAKGADKFVGLPYELSTNGSPVLGDVVAWIDCNLHAVYEAGDHYIALGEVVELETVRADRPLLFFQGKYGEFVGPAL